jgi:hypothetical protein
MFMPYKNCFYILYITLYNRIWKTFKCDIQNFIYSITLNVHIQLHSILKKNYRPFLLNFIYIDWKIPTAWLKWFLSLNFKFHTRGSRRWSWRGAWASWPCEGVVEGTEHLTKSYTEGEENEDVDIDKAPLKHIRFRSSIRYGIPIRCYLVVAHAHPIRKWIHWSRWLRIASNLVSSLFRTGLY